MVAGKRSVVHVDLALNVAVEVVLGVPVHWLLHSCLTVAFFQVT